MRARVAEHVLADSRRARVDLHGVSLFGPGEHRTLIRWESIVEIVVQGGVTVRSTNSEVAFPPGAFGLEPATLAGHLRDGLAIQSRPDAIGALASAGPRP